MNLIPENIEYWESKGISDQTPEEFQEHIESRIAVLVKREGLIRNTVATAPQLNLFGYGTVHEVLSGSEGHGYFWGHEAANALGWDQAEFAKWSEEQWHWDLVMQREADEESGTLGWDCIHHYPMHVNVWQGEGNSRDHYVNGVMQGPIMRYWTDLYLISTDRLMGMMMSSPWGEEWFESVKPMLSWGFKKSGLEDLLSGVKTYTDDVNSLGEVETRETGGSLGDSIARDREGVTEEEAIRRAFRGPVFDQGGEASC
ncbi:hypothetical protein [Goodfellowiella coeruleoviolacea]|uniref:Uncharacterized protein n=1 Tax=Goodfellowiella coeruleoviolacea TaxID=334858 RepID=A0AAE3KMX7_9PSEU|nr:hypothetical protein [Goodfellowiella coeruleoviolacea]MCP2168113.1 hypothetical protein [Goodfellowiella coeruleoviolacea]